MSRKTEMIALPRSVLEPIASAATSFAVLMRLRPAPRRLGTLQIDGEPAENLEWTEETSRELEGAVLALRRALGWKRA